MGMGTSGILERLRKNKAGSAKYDSLIERTYMLMLDEDPYVQEWTKEHSIRIPYQIFLFRHAYIPDFFVILKDGSKEIHETKGEGLMSWVTTHAKRDAAEKWCKERGYKYRLITPSKEWFYANPKERVGR